MLKFILKNVQEVRMGSHYNVCEIKFQGSWIPSLPKKDWQDLYAKDPKGRYLALVRWNLIRNNPGFKVIIIDLKKQTIKKSPRIVGCCDSISWNISGFNIAIKRLIEII